MSNESMSLRCISTGVLDNLIDPLQKIWQIKMW